MATLALKKRARHAEDNMSLRQCLDFVLSRHDYGALPPGVAALVRKLQQDIAWEEHRQQQRREVV
jgi:hypothetical protein